MFDAQRLQLSSICDMRYDEMTRVAEKTTLNALATGWCGGLAQLASLHSAHTHVPSIGSFEFSLMFRVCKILFDFANAFVTADATTAAHNTTAQTPVHIERRRMSRIDFQFQFLWYSMRSLWIVLIGIDG